MKKDNSSFPNFSEKEIMTLAENLAFLAGFAEGLANSKTPRTQESEEAEIEALIADAELELPKDGWKPVNRFKS